MTDDKEQRLATHAHARAIAFALAFMEPAVGSAVGWNYKQTFDLEYHWSAEITGPNGELLSVRTQYNKPERWLWSAAYPRDAANQLQKPYDAPSFEITVARTKSDAQIAAEIERRILREYRPWLVKAQERVASANSYAETTENSRDALLKAFGLYAWIPKHHGQEHTTRVYSRHLPHDVDATMNVSGDSVSIELRSVPLSLAVRIAQLISTPSARQTEEED